MKYAISTRTYLQTSCPVLLVARYTAHPEPPPSGHCSVTERPGQGLGSRCQNTARDGLQKVGDKKVLTNVFVTKRGFGHQAPPHGVAQGRGAEAGEAARPPNQQK